MEFEQMQNEVKQAMQTLLDAANGTNPKRLADEIVANLTSEHRTIQQSFLSAVKLALYQYANAQHDGRNEAAVQWAKQVADLPNGDLRFPII